MITKEIVSALLEAESKIQTLVKCNRCYGQGYWTSNYSTGSSEVRCDKCDGYGKQTEISQEEFTILVHKNLRALCESWLEQQEEIERLKGELNSIAWTPRRDGDSSYYVAIPNAQILEQRDQLTQTQDALEVACEVLEHANSFVMQRAQWPRDSDEDGRGWIGANRIISEALNKPSIQAARRKK